MFLAAVAFSFGTLHRHAVWRCSDEVFDLAFYRGKVVAATSGGPLVEMPGHRWIPLGKNGPAALRSLFTSSTGLEATDRSGNVFFLKASTSDWSFVRHEAMPAQSVLPTAKTYFHGQKLVSDWGSKYLHDSEGHDAIPRDPSEGDYALLAVGDRLLAGTQDGIYEFASNMWGRLSLPSQLPVARPQGIAFSGDAVVIGGLDGVFVNRGKGWIQTSQEPVRQVAKEGKDVVVLYGSGAVDRMDLVHDQLLYDVMNGQAKRPWVSTIGSIDGGLIFGGQGGWIERAKKRGAVSRYFPEINQDVVTATAARGGVRWIGTQKSGLWRYGCGAAKVWNPGTGLSDTWVTALLLTKQGLYIATESGGLFLVQGETITPVDSPTHRARQLCLYQGRVVLGAMDGAWIEKGRDWQKLPTNSEETTALVSGRRLVVATASGISWDRFES